MDSSNSRTSMTVPPTGTLAVSTLKSTRRSCPRQWRPAQRTVICRMGAARLSTSLSACLSFCLSFCLATTAAAGEHVLLDTGTDTPAEPVFMSTAAEQRRDGVTIVLRDHDPEDDTVLIAAWPAFGFTVCDRQPLRLYNAAAEVLEVPPAEGHMACLGRIPTRWVSDTVVARLPMFNARARTALLDTSSLQLDRLRVVRQ